MKRTTLTVLVLLVASCQMKSTKHFLVETKTKTIDDEPAGKGEDYFFSGSGGAGNLKIGGTHGDTGFGGFQQYGGGGGGFSGSGGLGNIKVGGSHGDRGSGGVPRFGGGGFSGSGGAGNIKIGGRHGDNFNNHFGGTHIIGGAQYSTGDNNKQVSIG